MLGPFQNTHIGDLSNNNYAAVMRELANGLSGWSGLLLLPFLIYQIIVNDSAALISIKAPLLILGAEIAFVIGSKLANMVLAAILAILTTPLAMKNKIELAQNILNTLLAIFGLSLCIAAWFFAGYAVNYVYASP